MLNLFYKFDHLNHHSLDVSDITNHIAQDPKNKQDLGRYHGTTSCYLSTDLLKIRTHSGLTQQSLRSVINLYSWLLFRQNIYCICMLII